MNENLYRTMLKNRKEQDGWWFIRKRSMTTIIPWCDNTYNLFIFCSKLKAFKKVSIKFFSYELVCIESVRHPHNTPRDKYTSRWDKDCELWRNQLSTDKSLPNNFASIKKLSIKHVNVETVFQSEVKSEDN